MTRSSLILLTLIILIHGCNSMEETAFTRIEELTDSFFRTVIRDDPELATNLGLSSDEYDFNESALTDHSRIEQDKFWFLVESYRDCLTRINRSQLADQQQLNYDIFDTYLELSMEKHEFRDHDYLINHFTGIHQQLLNLMTENHPLEDEEDARNYISRLEAFPERFSTHIDNIKYQAARGILPPKFIIKRYRDILSDFITSEPEDNFYYTSFKRKFPQLENKDISGFNSLDQKVLTAVREVVYPSYRELIDLLNEIEPDTDNRSGVWKLPEGGRFYQYCLQFHTTTELTPDQIHETGLEEVRRIQAEMIRLITVRQDADADDFLQVTGDFWAEAYNRSGNDLEYPDNEFGREKALNDYLTYLEQVQTKLPLLFSELPEQDVTIMRVPAAMENFAGQSYHRAPRDGSRPAVFYTNLSYLPFKPGMKTLVLHETVPGHHLQIALAQEKNLSSPFKDLIFFTGFIEGWALYAEKLGWENGWFNTDFEKMGYLGSELFRAVRLVVDTGIHFKKWSRQKAYDYMVENLGWGSFSELDRYIVWPGQACAYKIGELKILELREEASSELNDEFDIREFHRILLENGTISLPILEKVVSRYITETKGI